MVHELKGLLPAFIENIYQLDPITILLNVRQPGKPALNLIIESGKRMHLTAYALKKPIIPSRFCLALRKYLKGGRLNEIKQHEFERIIFLTVETRHGVFQLIVELFSKGNLILVNPKNTITLALSYRKMRDREILVGKPFRQPPPSGLNPLKITKQDLIGIRAQGDIEVVRGLVNTLSIGGIYAEEILLNANVDKKLRCSQLSDEQIDKIYVAVKDLISKLEGELKPYIVADKEGNWVDVIPFRLEGYREWDLKPHRTFNEAADEYFTRMTAEKTVKKATLKVEQEIKRYKGILDRQQKQLEELQITIKTNQKIGDLIYAHLNELQTLTQDVLKEKDLGKSWEQISAEYAKQKTKGISPANLFESISPKQRMINVKIDETAFSLDFHLSVQENAAKLYEKAKKARRKMKGLQEAIRETESKIKELNEKIVQVPLEISKPKKKPERAWYEKFHWFNSSDGFLVLGGKDAVSNELLIKHHTEPHDIVFHAEIVGAPIVVIKTEGKQPTDTTLKEAAQFAASYSRAWREGLGSEDVYWVKPAQVSKKAPSGHYMKTGAFMISGRRNYIRNVALGVAIGVQKIGDHWTAIGGPASAIKTQTTHYVEIVPGKQPSGKLAKQIRLSLAGKVSKSISKEILELPLEEFQKLIPAGEGELV